MTDVDPRLASDLSSLTKGQAVDLSKAASKERARQRRMQAAADWVSGMHRTFKGIAGRRTRVQLVRIAIDRFKLQEEE